MFVVAHGGATAEIEDRKVKADKLVCQTRGCVEKQQPLRKQPRRQLAQKSVKQAKDEPEPESLFFGPERERSVLPSELDIGTSKPQKPAKNAISFHPEDAIDDRINRDIAADKTGALKQLVRTASGPGVRTRSAFTDGVATAGGNLLTKMSIKPSASVSKADPVELAPSYVDEVRVSTRWRKSSGGVIAWRPIGNGTL